VAVKVLASPIVDRRRVRIFLSGGELHVPERTPASSAAMMNDVLDTLHLPRI
jgi:hypothetical protein